MIVAVLLGLAPAMASPRDVEAFARIVKADTAEARIYDGWYTALIVRATRMTAAVRSAQAARVAQVTGGAGTAPAAEGIEIVLSVSTQFGKELKFSANGDTPWTVLLSANGAGCAAPETIVAEKKVSAAERTLFPHITEWDKVFRLHYPADACGGAEPDALRVVGARGDRTLRWSR